MSANRYRCLMQGDHFYEMEMRGVITPQPLYDHDYILVDEVLSDLKTMKPHAQLRLNMASMGGDVDSAFQIANRIKQLQERNQIRSVETIAEGAVGSAATLLFLLGSQRVMRTGTRFMIHDPYTLASGPVTIEQHEQAAKKLRARRTEVAGIYATFTKQSEQEVLSAMAVATYYTPQEAVELGYATQAVEDLAIAACGPLTDNAPDELKRQQAEAMAEPIRLPDLPARPPAANV